MIFLIRPKDINFLQKIKGKNMGSKTRKTKLSATLWAVFGGLLMFAGMFLLFANRTFQWLVFANSQSGTLWSVFCMILTSLGSYFFMHKFKDGALMVLLTFMLQLITVFAFGWSGSLDAGAETTGLIFGLDAISGVSAATQTITAVVNAIKTLIPVGILATITIGIFFTDGDWDEIEQRLIEGGVAIGFVVALYGIGSWIGFM